MLLSTKTSMSIEGLQGIRRPEKSCANTKFTTTTLNPAKQLKPRLRSRQIRGHPALTSARSRTTPGLPRSKDDHSSTVIVYFLRGDLHRGSHG